MKGSTIIFRTIVAAWGLIGVLGCGGNPPQTESQGQLSRPADATPRTTPAASRASAPSADAQWTIAVRTIRGPNHVAESKRLKEDLIATTSLKNWYLIHGPTETQLFHGYYRNYEDPKDPDAAQARADLKAVREVKDIRGVAVFRDAMFTPIFKPDPEAPPEWNLVNSGGYWSLQIAAFQDHPDRKQAAVDSVREARAQGIEAYYYHGERVSSVCVGAWPREAFEQGESVVNDDARKRIIVTSDHLPEPIAQAMEKEGEAKNALVVTSQGRVHDRTLEAMMKRFPYHYVNDDVVVSRIRNPRTGKVVTVPDSSFLVRVPQPQPGVLATPMASTPGEQRPAAPPAAPAGRQVDLGQAIYGERQQPTQTRQPGKLRSIGD